MTRALIVGHTGQDGRLLWRQLQARGFVLAGVSRSDFAFSADDGGARSSSPAELVARFCPDQLYYLAAFHHSGEQASDATDVSECSWQTHVHGFEAVLDALRRHAPACRVFYASSSRIFGSSLGTTMDEASPWRPECVYGVTKAAGMLVAGQYRRAHGMHVSCGILFNHESPLRPRHFLSRRVVEGLVDLHFGLAGSLTLGSLDARTDWGYAPDYTRAMQLVVESNTPDDYVIATGETHSVRDFVDAAADRLGIDGAGRVVSADGVLARPSQELRGDSGRLRAVTGWAPSISFRDMVARLVDHALRERSILAGEHTPHDAAPEE